MLLQDKKIFITGGCSGIGKATAIKCLSEGAYVTIMDYAPAEKLEKLKQELGDKCFVFRGNAMEESDINAAVDYAVEKMGGLDGALNNVGGSTPGMIENLTTEQFDKCMKFSLYSVFFSIRAEVRHMNNGGSIVNTSSLNSQLPSEGAVAYNCAKAGLDALTRTAALEFGAKNIRVNAVRPGWINTEAVQPLHAIEEYRNGINERTPLGRFGRPEDIGNTVAFLLSDECQYMTGSVIKIDGGIEEYGNPNTALQRSLDMNKIYAEAYGI